MCDIVKCCPVFYKRVGDGVKNAKMASSSLPFPVFPLSFSGSLFLYILFRCFPANIFMAVKKAPTNSAWFAMVVEHQPNPILAGFFCF